MLISLISCWTVHKPYNQCCCSYIYHNSFLSPTSSNAADTHKVLYTINKRIKWPIKAGEDEIGPQLFQGCSFKDRCVRWMGQPVYAHDGSQTVLVEAFESNKMCSVCDACFARVQESSKNTCVIKWYIGGHLQTALVTYPISQRTEGQFSLLPTACILSTRFHYFFMILPGNVNFSTTCKPRLYSYI